MSSETGAIILLVEDERTVAEVVKAMLEELGYVVRCVPTISAALQAISEATFQLVLSDIELMPGPADGVQLARLLRTTHPALPVLLMSGHPGKAENAAGEFPVLSKPFGIGELKGAVLRLERSRSSS